MSGRGVSFALVAEQLDMFLHITYPSFFRTGRLSKKCTRPGFGLFCPRGHKKHFCAFLDGCSLRRVVGSRYRFTWDSRFRCAPVKNGGPAGLADGTAHGNIGGLG